MPSCKKNVWCYGTWGSCAVSKWTLFCSWSSCLANRLDAALLEVPVISCAVAQEFDAMVLEVHVGRHPWCYAIWITCVGGLDATLLLWPRVEQRKWILAKNKKTKTESPKKQIDRKNHQKKQEKNKKKQKLRKMQVFFVCFLFFLGFGFLVCFFCLLWFCFFVKPYILCVAGLISLEHRAATTLSWFTVCPYPNFRQPLKIPKTSSDPDMATDLFARRVDRNSRKDIPGRNHLNFINSSRGVHVAFT